MNIGQSYRLRLRRKRLNLRAFRKRRELICSSDQTASITKTDVLLFTTIKDEYVRLPYFLEYYRNLGVGHFLFVDNGSSDEGPNYLQQQSDVSLWKTKHSYRQSRFGMDWLTWLLRSYGHDHWCLIVDADELFVYPYCDTRPISALTDWLDTSGTRTFGAMLLDMYPKADQGKNPYRAGQNPLDISGWFDTGNYTFEYNPLLQNLWIQGGARARQFFHSDPLKAPALNKIPLIKWQIGYVYDLSTHMLLPRGLNLIYDRDGGEKACGALLHTKFLNLENLPEKAKLEIQRNEHYAQSYEYKKYHEALQENKELWTNWSEKYSNWRQLEILGLISKGNWA